jgi:hypothetical protein
VKQPRHPLADVDEDAEISEPIDCPAVVSVGCQLSRFGPTELEDDILLVKRTDTAIGRCATDDARSHYGTEVYPD